MYDYEIILRKRGVTPDENVQAAVRLTEEMVENSEIDILDISFQKLKEDLYKNLPVKFKTIYKREVFESTPNQEI
jgi:hypothetical protein